MTVDRSRSRTPRAHDGPFHHGKNTGSLRAIVYMALVHIIGALVGAALALVVFLVAIMKS